MNLKKQFNGTTLTRFLEEIESNQFHWFVKRLSGNDTGLTGSHQAGVFIPGTFIVDNIPHINRTDIKNPDIYFECYFPFNDILIPDLRAIYYNNKVAGDAGTRNEFRITRWGGQDNPTRNPENTGSIFLFAYNAVYNQALAWVASSIEEEDIFEDWLGEEIEPLLFYFKEKKSVKAKIPSFKIPTGWYSCFPDTKDIFNFIATSTSENRQNESPDKLILKRRNMEYELYKYIENIHVIPQISHGFASVDAFVKYANSITNRRKVRAGKSLENNLELIFREEAVFFNVQVITENNKKPDFIFPSAATYHNRKMHDYYLHMLAAKTCCKDRWRQIINEADRIKTKHLFTFQDGISANQLQEMKDNNVVLVVPEPLMHSYPLQWRNDIFTLEEFIAYIKNIQCFMPPFPSIPGLTGSFTLKKL